MKILFEVYNGLSIHHSFSMMLGALERGYEVEICVHSDYLTPSALKENFYTRNRFILPILPLEKIKLSFWGGDYKQDCPTKER